MSVILPLDTLRGADLTGACGMKVAAVMLTHRPDLAECARACFYRQTYRDKILVELDTRERTESVGVLRNEINAMARAQGADVIVHWDDDDWSADDRIETQVEMLGVIVRVEGANGVTGFNRVPFWDERVKECWIYYSRDPKTLIGSSLCYGVGLPVVFDDTMEGEDFRFLARVDRCLIHPVGALFGAPPLMVARIHDRNTSTAYDRDLMRTANEWTRSPQFDEFCEGVFAR